MLPSGIGINCELVVINKVIFRAMLSVMFCGMEKPASHVASQPGSQRGGQPAGPVASQPSCWWQQSSSMTNVFRYSSICQEPKLPPAARAASWGWRTVMSACLLPATCSRHKSFTFSMSRMSCMLGAHLAKWPIRPSCWQLGLGLYGRQCNPL